MSKIDDSPPTLTEQLWREHAPELLRFATVLVGPSDAHDLVVEAVLKASDSLALGDVRNRRAYLFRAVSNRAHDLRRSRERRWVRDLAAIGPPAGAPPDSFVDVRRAVAELSLSQRAVVYFVYWEDLTERDTAALLQVSPGTVRRHLFRARNQLRKALQ